ncbi:MAG: efflux RND transporter periplasmic adaptor subunit [Gemmatimonadaceae bacterium]
MSIVRAPSVAATRAILWVLTSVSLTLACRRDGGAEARAATKGSNGDVARNGVTIGTENVTVVQSGEISSGPVLSGTLTPRNEATIRAEVAGAVLQTYADKGQSVARGALLARLDDSAIRDSWLSARSAVSSAQQAADLATRNAERGTALQAAGAVSQRDLETVRSAAAAGQAQLADARARLALAEKQLQKTQIRAPFSGVVSDRPVSAGDVVQPGAAIITVVDPSSMKLEGSVPAEAIGALKRGQPVQFQVNGYPGKSFTGHIDRINPTADPATRQVRVTVSLPNSGNTLVGGLFADGRVSSETRNGLTVPVAAVDQRGVRPAVMRLRQGQVEQVAVELGLRDEHGERVEIRSGVAAGDTLLLGAAQGITAGTPVRVLTTNDRGAAVQPR